MVSPEIPLALHHKLYANSEQRIRRTRNYLANVMMWLCLILACSGTSWFAYQYFLVPQTETYTPDWQQARWVQPVDIQSPTAYFRYGMTLSALPDNAFITITANQVFQLYINGLLLGTNVQDFIPENTPRAYMLDIDSVLKKGTNVIGVRVVDVDHKKPALRANIGITAGPNTYYYGTNDQWQATGNTTLVHPRHEATPFKWTTKGFDASRWQPATAAAQPSGTRALSVNPIIYTYPHPTHWITPGISEESYFVHQVQVPAHIDSAYIRLVATGKADIFINDHEYMKWDGQVPAPQDNIVTFLHTHDHAAHYRNDLLMGMYNVTRYLHPGTNTLAIHVQSPGNTTAKVGLDSHKSAMSIDLLAGRGSSYSNLLASDLGWHASSSPVSGWTHISSAAKQWPQPYPLGRPGPNRSYYIPDSTTTHSIQVTPPMLTMEIILYSTCAILLFWLLAALFVLGRYIPERRTAYQLASLLFLPALVVEGLLVVLAREPLIPQPFPYNTFCGLILIALVCGCTAALWHLIRRRKQQAQKQSLQEGRKTATRAYHTRNQQLAATETQLNGQSRQQQRRWELLYRWSRQHWGLLAIMLFAVPLVCYRLNYEPLWQDELSSYYAARHIMTHGYPAFVSGFVYPKGELFSYLMALVLSIFGTTNAMVARMIAVSEYLVSLPLFYIFMQRIFNRRIAWLATALLAFSPYELLWSRQIRMYEQAQFMVILVMFTLYRAIQQRDQKRPVYLALLCLTLAYFSHEENFIILPAALICTLIATREGPYGIPAILRKKHWWSVSLLATSLVLIQLMVVYWSHPPTFATDQSRRPQIDITTDNLPYYVRLLFSQPLIKQGAAPWGSMQPWLGVTSTLMVLGCILAFCQKGKPIRYYATFLLISMATLICLFTMEADRYYYPLLPLYYLMGSFAFWQITGAFWRFARPLLLRAVTPSAIAQTNAAPRLPRSIIILTRAMLCILCITILSTPILPISNYNLLVSRVLGLNYRHHFADYNNVGEFMHAHMQQGDVVLTISPAIVSYYYVGHVDDYLSVNRALFLFEQDGAMRETTSGAHPILNQTEFTNLLATRARIWIITDNGNYQAGATRFGRFTFPPPDFRMVYEGYGTAVYARSLSG